MWLQKKSCCGWVGHKFRATMSTKYSFPHVWPLLSEAAMGNVTFDPWSFKFTSVLEHLEGQICPLRHKLLNIVHSRERNKKILSRLKGWRFSQTAPLYAVVGELHIWINTRCNSIITIHMEDSRLIFHIIGFLGKKIRTVTAQLVPRPLLPCWLSSVRVAHLGRGQRNKEECPGAWSSSHIGLEVSWHSLLCFLMLKRSNCR